MYILSTVKQLNLYQVNLISYMKFKEVNDGVIVAIFFDIVDFLTKFGVDQINDGKRCSRLIIYVFDIYYLDLVLKIGYVSFVDQLQFVALFVFH